MKYLNDKQIIHIYRFYKRKKLSVDSSYISDQKKGLLEDFVSDMMRLGSLSKVNIFDKMTNCAVLRDVKKLWMTKSMWAAVCGHALAIMSTTVITRWGQTVQQRLPVRILADLGFREKNKYKKKWQKQVENQQQKNIPGFNDWISGLSCRRDRIVGLKHIFSRFLS